MHTAKDNFWMIVHKKRELGKFWIFGAMSNDVSPDGNMDADITDADEEHLDKSLKGKVPAENDDERKAKKKKTDNGKEERKRRARL
jgi:hypothetical protein